MAKFGKPLNLTDYRAVLTSTGELEIGAYARRKRRRRMLVAWAGVALILVGAGVAWMLWQPESAPATDGYPVVVRCVTCAWEGTIRTSARHAFPLTCPRCKERSAREVWRCRNPACGARFVPDDPTRTPSCPICKGTRVGSAAAEP